MAEITFVVYDPPAPGLPYLAAMIAPDGEVVVAPYPTAEQAEAHNRIKAAQAAKVMKSDA